MKTLSVLAALALPGAAAGADAGVGVRDIEVWSEARGAAFAVTLWYPAAEGGGEVRVGENGVFAGTPALRDAVPVTRPMPVVLLSHGGMRAAPDQDGWIAARLAAGGYLVASAHPPSRGLKPQDAPRELWLRPAELAATLDALAGDAELAGLADMARVGVLGFLLGGTSALSLAGGRLDRGRYAASCDRPGENPDCGWFESGGVDLRALAGSWPEAGAADARIRAVVAVAPELVGVFEPESLAGIGVPVRVVGLGEAVGVPGAEAEVLAGATPFDAFGLCKPKGAAILREDGGDARLCADGALPRAEVHDRLGATILAAFAEDLE